MSQITEETARDLIEAIRELTFVVKGLTGVLIEDRDTDQAEPEPPAAALPTYMDGSAVGG